MSSVFGAFLAYLAFEIFNLYLFKISAPQAAVHTIQESATEKANVALVREMFGDLESDREDAFVARTATAISIEELMLPESLHGRAAAAAWFKMWSAEGLTIEVTRMLGVGNDVLVETITQGTLSAPIGPLSVGPQPFAVHRAFIVQIAHSRIARIISFMNGRELAESSGQWPLRKAAHGH